MDPILAYQQETSRIMADTINMEGAQLTNFPGVPLSAAMGGPQALQFQALHNPMLVSSQPAVDSRGQSMPFQQLLQVCYQLRLYQK